MSLPLVAAHHDPEREAVEARNAMLDAETPVGDLQGVKILTIDDDIDSATVVSRILRRQKAEVRAAHSIEEGLRLVEEFRPDVIFSDIGMPGHDGYEFIKRLRAGPGRAIPAVALTALARKEDRTRALRAGFQMHIAKPVDSAELIAVVLNLAKLPLQRE